MKTRLLKFTLMAVAVCGFALPLLAADSTPDARFSSDTPVVTTIFRHTAEKPYDIKCLTWYGGVMQRIVAENKSSQPVTIHFVMAHLVNGVVAVPARRTTVIKDCAPGATVTLMDLLSKDGDAAVAYKFTHESVITETAVVTHVDSGSKLSVR